MKKKFVNYLAIMAISFGFITSSCTKDEANDLLDLEQVNLKSLVTPTSATTCDLIAGQYINTGKVLYWQDEVNLYVKYETNAPWKLYEVHLYVGPKTDMPATKKGAPKIGHFPYSDDKLGGVMEWNQTIPLSVLDDCVIIAAHAVVATNDDMIDEETAWSKCGAPILAIKTFFTDGTWQASTGNLSRTAGGDIISYGTPFFEGSTNWCKDIGYNTVPYEDNNFYSFVQYGSPVAGSILVVKAPSALDISFDVPGKTADYSYVYYGPAFASTDCPEYYKWPTYAGENISVPAADLTSSIPFEASRWGWYSEYCK